MYKFTRRHSSSSLWKDRKQEQNISATGRLVLNKPQQNKKQNQNKEKNEQNRAKNHKGRQVKSITSNWPPHPKSKFVPSDELARLVVAKLQCYVTVGLLNEKIPSRVLSRLYRLFFPHYFQSSYLQSPGWGDEDVNGEQKQVGAFLGLLFCGHRQVGLVTLTPDSCYDFLPEKTKSRVSISPALRFFLFSFLFLSPPFALVLPTKSLNKGNVKVVFLSNCVLFQQQQ